MKSKAVCSAREIENRIEVLEALLAEAKIQHKTAVAREAREAREQEKKWAKEKADKQEEYNREFRRRMEERENPR